jgi:uncharacterized membrane protein YccC
MTSRKKTRIAPIRALLTQVRSLADSLPSQEERRQASEDLEAVIGFLRQTQDQLAALPTAEETAALREAVRRSEVLLEQAESDQALRAALGLRLPRGGAERLRAAQPSAENAMRGRAIMAELEPLPVDDIKARLRDENRYSVAELRGAAAVVGIPSHRKLGRQALAHQIAMKIANLRGYERLGGQAEQHPVVSEPADSRAEGHQEKLP